MKTLLKHIPRPLHGCRRSMKEGSFSFLLPRRLAKLIILQLASLSADEPCGIQCHVRQAMFLRRIL